MEPRNRCFRPPLQLSCLQSFADQELDQVDDSVEYPHSLSYQEITFTRLPSRTLVICPSTIELLGLCSMSVDTIGSSV